MSWRSGYNVISTRCTKCQSLRLGINFKLDETVACKGIQDSLGFYIPRRVLRIPGAGFQSLSLKLGFFIPDWSDILDFFLSCSCIPGSQTLGFWIPSAKIYPAFRIPDSLALRRPSDRFWYWVVTQFWPCYSEWPGMKILFFSVGSVFASMLLFTTNFLCKKVVLIQQSPKWPFILMQKEMNNLLV